MVLGEGARVGGRGGVVHAIAYGTELSKSVSVLVSEVEARGAGQRSPPQRGAGIIPPQVLSCKPRKCSKPKVRTQL